MIVGVENSHYYCIVTYLSNSVCFRKLCALILDAGRYLFLNMIKYKFLSETFKILCDMSVLPFQFILSLLSNTNSFADRRYHVDSYCHVLHTIFCLIIKHFRLFLAYLNLTNSFLHSCCKIIRRTF
jgi:hypothetical protein